MKAPFHAGMVTSSSHRVICETKWLEPGEISRDAQREWDKHANVGGSGITARIE